MIAIIPVKLENAKTRLSGILSMEKRKELVLTMLGDVLEALEDIDILIVTPSKFSFEKFFGRKFKILEEKKPLGLNKAVRKATEYAINNGQPTIFLPSDIPLIKRKDIDMIEKLGEDYNLILSPSRDGGITALFRRPPDIVRECFSSKSFESFIKEAEKNNIPYSIYSSPSLSIDIDTPQDVEEFMLIGKGTRTYEFLENLEVEIEICAKQ